MMYDPTRGEPTPTCPECGAELEFRGRDDWYCEYCRGGERGPSWYCEYCRGEVVFESYYDEGRPGSSGGWRTAGTLVRDTDQGDF